MAYNFKNQSNYGFPNTFEATGKFPLIANRIFKTYKDALEFINDFYDTAVPGLTLSVIDDGNNNGIYFVTKVASGADTNDGELQKVSTNIEVTNYSEAKEISTGLTVGTIINITNDETIYDEENDPEHESGETVTAGFYIVTGKGSVSSLSTAPAGAADYAATIETLRGEVKTLKSELVELQEKQASDDTAHLVGGDDIDGIIE
jgi:hypothetical protein